MALDAQIDLAHKTQTELQLVRPLKEATIERIDREIDEIDAALEERRQLREKYVRCLCIVDHVHASLSLSGALDYKRTSSLSLLDLC